MMQTTNSSTSSSDAQASRWRGVAVTFGLAAAAVFAFLAATLLALDPYDTGRLALFESKTIPRQGPRTASVSRGRDPAFNAAILGNSHIQLVMPQELDAATRLRFVSLIVPATGPREQLVLMRYFLDHHPDPRAFVIGIDRTWCTGDPALPVAKPFPFWLYERSTLAYALGLIRTSALEHIPGRIAGLAGKIQPARRDGYWDYEAEYRRIGYGDPDFVARKLATPRPTSAINQSDRFPAAEALRAVLKALPSSTAVALIRPPVYISGQPQPGSDADRESKACRATFAALADERPGTVLVDWATERPENLEAGNFLDLSHYRAHLARRLEADIAAALKAGKSS